MYWTKAHDTLLCREILALEPYKHKKGSNEAGKIWTDIAQSLKNCQQLKFKQNLSQRAVRERFSLLQTRYKENEREETRASGISPEQDELDVLLEEITEREKAAEENREDVNRKKENDKVTAEEMRKQAMERMSQTNQKDNGGDMKDRRKRRSGNDAVDFLKEKCQREMALREKEIEKKDKANQFQVMVNQQQTLLQAMQQQQAQQQSQNLHMIMAQQNQAIMALLEKVIPKH
ncbi:uncharacterized protein LOC122950339 [Acropora millepora]|uniref:uncharacterized protein LOC122950339 n=1 Tax=Acropora millepora TaxID=45264 RepID=UPI001CF469E1|nr:uncharacterized protein LOC122950339 [Acropora millepora]